MQLHNMDLPKKRTNKYVTGVYAVFIIFFIFTVSLFYIARCQKSTRLAEQEDQILKSKGSAENLPKVSEKIDIPKEPWDNKIEATKTDNIADDENLNTPLSKKDSSNKKKTTIDGLKTPASKASNPNPGPNPDPNSDPNSNPIQPQLALTSARQKVAIFFSAESTGLTNHALEKLKVITVFILKHPDLEIIIEGYGDSNENHRHNKNLSQLRANIVKSYLVRKGIDIARIKAFWMGSENPAGGDDSQEDSNKTHQVEVRFKMSS